MVDRRQSWWHSTLVVWRGYFFTALAAIPASAIGLLLVKRGISQSTSIYLAIALAVLGGFAVEGLIALSVRPKRPLVKAEAMPSAYQLDLAPTSMAVASFVLVVTGTPSESPSTQIVRIEPPVITSRLHHAGER